MHREPPPPRALPAPPPPARSVEEEMAEYLQKRPYVSAQCRLTEEEEQRVLDRLPATPLFSNRRKVHAPHNPHLGSLTG